MYFNPTATSKLVGNVSVNSTKNISIASFNVMNQTSTVFSRPKEGRETDFQHKKRCEKITSILLDHCLECDIICLQEVTSYLLDYIKDIPGFNLYYDPACVHNCTLVRSDYTTKILYNDCVDSYSKVLYTRTYVGSDDYVICNVHLNGKPSETSTRYKVIDEIYENLNDICSHTNINNFAEGSLGKCYGMVVGDYNQDLTSCDLDGVYVYKKHLMTSYHCFDFNSDGKHTGINNSRGLVRFDLKPECNQYCNIDNFTSNYNFNVSHDVYPENGMSNRQVPYRRTESNTTVENFDEWPSDHALIIYSVESDYKTQFLCDL